MIIKEAVENMTAFENDKVKELFEACDLDASGYIDQYELAAVVDLDPDDLREIFSQLDRDGDGKISIEDFTDNYKRFANLATQVDKKHGAAESKTNNQPVATASPSHRQPEKISPRRRSDPRLSRSLDSSLSDRNLKYMIKDAGGQEYLEQIYEAIASSNNPELLAALEKFVSSQIDAVQQRNADNQRLDEALRRATEKNSEIARHLEEEMEQQMLTLESRIRDEERRKAERMLLEAHWKIEAKAKELQAMNEKVKKLEATLQLAEGEDDDELKREIEDKIDENINLQSQLREYQTQMAVMRSEMASLKSEYDEQSERLNRERQTVLQCVQEQENLTRQLHLLHEANKKLHDTNDDLRAALETKRSGRSPSPLKRSISFTSPRSYHHKPNMYSSSRPDFDDQSSEISSTATSPPLIDDEISLARPANHQPYGDEDDVNEASLMSELLAADEKAEISNSSEEEGILNTSMGLPDGVLPAKNLETDYVESDADKETPEFVDSETFKELFQSASKLQDDDDETYGAIPKQERENFLKQLEILCETNKRLSQSNDELRNALAIVADQVKKNNKKPKNLLRASSSNSDYASGQGSRSQSPARDNNEMEAPQSTSSPVKAVSAVEKPSVRKPVSEEELSEEETAKPEESTNTSSDQHDLNETVVGRETGRMCQCGKILISNEIESHNCTIKQLTDPKSLTERKLLKDNTTDIKPNTERDIPLMSEIPENELLKPLVLEEVEAPSHDLELKPLSEVMLNDTEARDLNIDMATQVDENDFDRTETDYDYTPSLYEGDERSEENLGPLDKSIQVSSSHFTDDSRETIVTDVHGAQENKDPKREKRVSIPVEEDLVTEVSYTPDQTYDDHYFDRFGDQEEDTCSICKSHIDHASDKEGACLCTQHLQGNHPKERDVTDSITGSAPLAPPTPFQDTTGTLPGLDPHSVRSRPSDMPSLMTEQLSESETSTFYTGRDTARRSRTYSSDALEKAARQRSRPPIGYEETLESQVETTGIQSSFSYLQNIEEELSQYARRGSDEEFDEDDMEDDELAKLVDMTSGSDSEIEVAEKVTIEEVRGIAVGADAPPSERSIQSYSPSPNVEPERMYKLVLAGDAAVGKSSFIIRLCKGKFYTALNSTLGVDFQVKTLTVDNHVVALQLWDTAGQERFRSIAKSYFRKVDGVILLYDVTCEASFKDVRGWLESVEESAQKPVPVIICGNKTDLRPEMKARGERVIGRDEGERLAKEVGALFIETSAKDGSNIAETCVELARKLYKNEDKEVQNGGMKLQEETKAEAKKKSSCCK